MSDLERAQEWLGCEHVRTHRGREACATHSRCDPYDDKTWTWPCSEATRLAALLAETRADALENIATLIDVRLLSARSEELDDVAAEFERSANRVVKAKGETERTRYAYEVVEVLRNRAREIRDA